MKGYGVRGVGHALAVALLAATSSVSITVAQAQQQTAQRQFIFNIPAKPVTQAVNDIGRIVGLSVAFRENQAITANGNPIRGSLTAQQALSTLLAGTGLTYRFSNASTVQIYDPSASAANSAAISEDGSMVLDTIVVQGQGGRLSEPYAGGQVARGGNLGVLGNVDIMDAPFSQTSYTEKHIRDQQARNLPEVLASDSSARTVHANSSYSDYYVIRGFSPTYPQENAVNGVLGISPDNRTPVELFERVDVLKGPSAFLFGTTSSSSVGGTINLTTKKATEKPINSVSTDYSSKSTFGTHIDFGRRFGPASEFGIRANGILRGGSLNADDISRHTGAGSIGLDYDGGALRASFDAMFLREETKGVYGNYVLAPNVEVLRPPRAGWNPLPHDGVSTVENAFALAKIEYDIGNTWTAYGNIGYKYYYGDYRFSSQTNIHPNGDFNALLGNRQNEGHTIVGEAGVRGEFWTGAIRHNLTVNGSYQNKIVNDSPFTLQILPPQNVYHPTFFRFFDVTKKELIKRDDQTFLSASVSDTISFFDDRLKLTVGARYQDIESQTFDINTRQPSSNYRVDAITPMVGIVFKPRDNISIYASYIEGLSPGFSVTDVLAPNYGAVFAPQKTEQYEAGVKWDIGSFGTTLSVFQISEPSIASDPYTNEYSVNGLKRVRGVEWNVFGELRDDLRVLGGITFMEGVQQKTAGGANDGKQSPGVPDIQANLGFEWDTPWVEGLTLSARAIHTSSQYVNYANTQKIPAWTRVDIGARYQTKVGDNNLTLRGNIENLFDSNYWESPNWGNTVRLSSPRTFRISATVDF